MNIKNKLILVVGGNGLIGNEIIKEIKSNDGIPINLDIMSCMKQYPRITSFCGTAFFLTPMIAH